MFNDGRRVIMCSSMTYNGIDAELNGMNLRGRVWATLAERDHIRKWDAGKTILTSRCHKTVEGEAFVQVWTNNNIYICPSDDYIHADYLALSPITKTYETEEA